jgi:hypothetical protein
MIDVAVILLNDNYASTAIGPIEVFHSAGFLWQALKGETPSPRFRVTIASLDGKPVTSPYPMQIAPQVSIRSVKDADLIIVLGTRMNYIISHAAPPRFNAAAKIARIDIDATEIATAARKVDIGIVGDCRMVLNQLLAGLKGNPLLQVQAERLGRDRRQKRPRAGQQPRHEQPQVALDDPLLLPKPLVDPFCPFVPFRLVESPTAALVTANVNGAFVSGTPFVPVTCTTRGNGSHRPGIPS